MRGGAFELMMAFRNMGKDIPKWLHLWSGSWLPMATGSSDTVTVSGVSPLSIPGAVAGALLSLVQKGKCVVDSGVIKCNNGTLFQPNLADMSESNVMMGKFINNAGGESSSTSNFYCAELIPVDAGADYTMHTSVRVGYYSVMEYDTNGDFIKRTLYGSNNYRAGDIITHTMGESTDRPPKSCMGLN